MSKSEKRYVKLVGSTFSKKEKNYLLLFDILDKQNHFDLEKIKEELKQKGVNYSYSMLRGYLYDFLLDNLLKYNNDDLEYELTSQYHKAKFLCERGLFQESTKVINKLQTRLEELNKFHYLLVPVIGLKFRVYEANSLEGMIEFRKPIWKEWRRALRASEEVLDSRLKIERFFEATLEKGDAKINIENFLSEEDFEIESLTTLSGQYNHLYLLVVCYIELGEIEKAQFYIKEIRDLARRYDPQALSENVKMQIWELQLWSAVNDKDAKEFKKIFHSVDEDGFRNDMSYSHFLFRKHTQLASAIENGVYPIGNFDTKLFIKDIDKSSVIVTNDQIAEQYLIHIALLMKFGEYKKASYLNTHWLGKVENKKEAFFLGAKFQSCLLEFSLRKYYSVKSKLISVESFANRHNNMIIKKMTIYLKEIVREMIKEQKEKKNIEEAFDNFLTYWKALKPSEQQKIFLKFDLENWLLQEKKKVIEKHFTKVLK